MNRQALFGCGGIALLIAMAGCQDTDANSYVDYADTRPAVQDAPETAALAGAASSAGANNSGTEPDESADVAADSEAGPAAVVQADRTEHGSNPLSEPSAPAADSVADTTPVDSAKPVSESPDVPSTTGGSSPHTESTDSAATESVLNSSPAGTGQQSPVESAAGGPKTVDAEPARTEPAPAAPVEPNEIKLLIPGKTFSPEGDARALRLTYDDIDLLKILNMAPVPADADRYFPDWLTTLDGQRIRIRGFMFPTFEATGLTAFTMARDNGICCFVRQPKIYDVIGVLLADGETTDYIEGKPFDVEGTFRIMPEVDEGELFGLYRIEDARVLK